MSSTGRKPNSLDDKTGVSPAANITAQWFTLPTPSRGARSWTPPICRISSLHAFRQTATAIAGPDRSVLHRHVANKGRDIASLHGRLPSRKSSLEASSGRPKTTFPSGGAVCRMPCHACCETQTPDLRATEHCSCFCFCFCFFGVTRGLQP
ncbi:hypothetical protein CMUS01_01067 [Colletotrichum musicola]|uniref:Uncharacterized protein n=1 Tax=Colletotrichum musicola TaxID=2175873 RepID=A0A8H6NXS6_9PEZI|nr:hypothetical protein CMUS01_01067 [Colletotrichum musicola]